MLHATKMAVSKCPCLTLNNVMFRRQKLRVIGSYKHQHIVPSTLLASATDLSARNVFRYLYSIFMFAAFLVIFVFAPLVLLLGSLVFHCPRSFVLRVRIFLHIVYLAFILFFRVSRSLVALGPVYSLMFAGVLLVLVFRPYLAIVL